MAEAEADRLYISTNGFLHAIGLDDARIRAEHEAFVRAEYDRCHPDDSFDDLKRRARFSKEDQGLLSEWLALGALRAGEQAGA